MKVLAIGAHFDDIELGCSGTLLKHKEQGDEVYLLVITHSSYCKDGEFYRSAEDAKNEGVKSASKLGAKMICLEKDPLVLLPTEEFVLDIEKIVKKINPDRVYTHQPTDTHADHAAVGAASIRACRKCHEVFLYRSNWYIMDSSPNDNFYVDISGYIDEKVELIKIFESEMKKVNYTWVDFVKKQNEAAGAKIFVQYAETFHIVKMFWK
ncbi:MAG: PIG-L family deacetylase [gamma proteobacterium symbiont of Taylorina sp.]|nr:PIG-L family deacetylase [gamma proteobacterium symbiont of Taylorina sp.]